MDLIIFLIGLLNKRCCDNWLSTQKKKKGLNVYFTPHRSKLKTDTHSKCPLC